jgi:hypothetical protein
MNLFTFFHGRDGFSSALGQGSHCFGDMGFSGFFSALRYPAVDHIFEGNQKP